MYPSLFFIYFASLHFIYRMVSIFEWLNWKLYWKIMICSPRLNRPIIINPSKRVPPSKLSIKDHLAKSNDVALMEWLNQIIDQFVSPWVVPIPSSIVREFQYSTTPLGLELEVIICAAADSWGLLAFIW